MSFLRGRKVVPTPMLTRAPLRPSPVGGPIAQPPEMTGIPIAQPANLGVRGGGVGGIRAGRGYMHTAGGAPDHRRVEDGPTGVKALYGQWPGLSPGKG